MWSSEERGQGWERRRKGRKGILTVICDTRNKKGKDGKEEEKNGRLIVTVVCDHWE